MILCRLIGSRLVLVRAVLESVGPEGDDFIVMCVSGSVGRDGMLRHISAYIPSCSWYVGGLGAFTCLVQSTTA